MIIHKQYLKHTYAAQKLSQYSTKSKRESNYSPEIYKLDVFFNYLKVFDEKVNVFSNLNNTNLINDIVDYSALVFKYIKSGSLLSMEEL
ncbi:hypothetical protein QJ130_02705 [Metamycoplasma hyosynoviae]|uniref:Uncharacterized protein n=1 Tax=Metamycoplasma hyosynoviae TaxID=29559 RepID=A0AAP4AP77_9BACT|nr:hypothetical protein [Metamycoplasma hyosynoviae]MDC8921187.1 hypothetical protein [Metamycoplasma hyosynoviae]MDD1372113.1 hypothetical protein [Metamycoplasma hyosynoviae]MDI3048214.1 hypothetical protein [Metamycoplasma hyosynoviae]MDI3102891.1 hypothetical protein [Metamycoplasma hyosynoviae]MDI3118258.1 hypothetical protein [Metamycoplasma hyosynoviae]